MPFADGTIRYIVGCEEGRILDPDAVISMNFWCFTPSMMRQLESELTSFLRPDDPRKSLTAECTLPEVVDCLIQRDEPSVEMLRTKAVWFGVTYREDKPSVMAELEKLHAAKAYPEKLESLTQLLASSAQIKDSCALKMDETRHMQ